MKAARLARVTVLCTCAALLRAQSSSTTNGWKLVWSDEFNGPAGSPPNPANWNFDLGGGGWGNGEAETYTNSAANASMDGKGHLVISALRDASGNFTSARLRTGNVGESTDTADLSWKYGLVEARIHLPFGAGVWPAFWMLGEDYRTVNWPDCGEIDILENFGANIETAAIVHGTIHGPGQSPDYSVGASFTLPWSERFSDDFHVFAIEWSENQIAFSVDGSVYQTVTPASLPAGTQWEFNSPLFLILNLAIGGPTTFLGTPAASTYFPQDMLVDYVRVYQSVEVSATTPVITPGRVVSAASYLGALAPGSLALLDGANLAADTYQGNDLIDANGHYVTTIGGVSVTVNGVDAPLIYVSPGQINFQIPWETPAADAVSIQVTRSNASSNIESVAITKTAPALFAQDFVTGAVFVTACSNGLRAGSACELLATGLGPKNSPRQADQDGAPVTVVSPLSGLEVPGGTAACQLSIQGQVASVSYCGALPDSIIDEIKFVYPAGVTPASTPVYATLKVGGNTVAFQFPALPQ